MSEKEKFKKWWKSLNPREKEGMKRLGVVGAEGAGIALALTYEPQALPIVVLPASTYINRMRIKKALQKAHILKKVI
jgi:hypothetical protein